MVKSKHKVLVFRPQNVANLKVRNASLKLQEEALTKNNQQKEGPFREAQTHLLPTKTSAGKYQVKYVDYHAKNRHQPTLPESPDFKHKTTSWKHYQM